MVQSEEIAPPRLQEITKKQTKLCGKSNLVEGKSRNLRQHLIYTGCKHIYAQSKAGLNVSSL